MNFVWFILAGVVFAIVYCYFVSLLLFAVGRTMVRRLKEKTMDKTKEWYFSWPAIVVGLLVVQLFLQCYLAKLPDTRSTSELFDGMLLLYMVFAALVVVGKRERDSYRKSQERPRQDAEKQRLVGRINEPEDGRSVHPVRVDGAGTHRIRRSIDLAPRKPPKCLQAPKNTLRGSSTENSAPV
jgi:hypothetical protein